MKIKINQKPINLDVHLKYRCPNLDCSYYHWLSLKETQTKNFKVVCDCGTVFSIQRIKKVKIKYIKKNTKTQTQEHRETKIVTNNFLESVILDKCSKALIQYGFTKLESEDLVKKSFNIVKSNDVSLIMKKCLELIGENKI